MEAVRFYREPELRNPSLVAAWPGMGGVAIVAARYLREKLGAHQLGVIEPYDFFDPTLVLVHQGITRELEFPENRLWFWESGAGNDLVILTAESQPASGSYRLANLVLDISQRFNAKRVYTFAAAPTHMYHTKTPRVLGAATSPKLIPELKKHGIALLEEGTISGMNGLLLGVARERNIDGICLLGEIPIYTTQIANPRSSKAVLEVFSELSGVQIDLSEIDEWAKRTDLEIEGHIERLKESYGEEIKGLIDYFEQLKGQASAEERETQLEYRTEELFKDIEQFLMGRGEPKEDKG